MTENSIAFIGGGNMASSLITGLLANGYPRSKICASDTDADARGKLEENHNIATRNDNSLVARDADIVVLAVKPQVLEIVAKNVASTISSESAVISIAAGVPISALEYWLGDKSAVVRAMPNTPALVLAGATGLFANRNVTTYQKRAVEKIFGAVGYSCWAQNEEHIDFITAISGSGPAYFLMIFEIMQQLATELGLPREQAVELIMQTALGTAKMARNSPLPAEKLRRQVTSPGGTTEAAIQAFKKGGLEDLFREAITEAVKRAAEISNGYSC